MTNYRIIWYLTVSLPGSHWRNLYVKSDTLGIFQVQVTLTVRCQIIWYTTLIQFPQSHSHSPPTRLPTPRPASRLHPQRLIFPCSAAVAISAFGTWITFGALDTFNAYGASGAFGFPQPGIYGHLSSPVNLLNSLPLSSFLPSTPGDLTRSFCVTDLIW